MDPFPTRYSGLSNSEVNELYRSETWDGLNRDERLDALQELENRSAESLGNRPCEVRLEQMEGAAYGGYSDGVIYVNEGLVENGELTVNFEDGTTMQYTPDDTNAQLMDTIHHENYHSYQDEVINGRLEHSDQAEAELWRANDENYIRGSDNESLYRVQSLERSAFDHGEIQTKAAFEEIEAKYGADDGFQTYQENISNSYENALTTAQTQYGENVQENLDNHMLANYSGSHANDNAANISQMSREVSTDNDTSYSNNMADGL
jgi:hypothetical protein